MSETPRGFEETLEALAEERRRSEAELAERLEVLQERMERLASAAEEAAAQAAEIGARPPAAIPEVAGPDTAEPVVAEASAPPTPPGFIASWLLGDRLDRIEREHARALERVATLEGRVGGLRQELALLAAAAREADAAAAAALHQGAEEQLALNTSLRGTLNHAIEAMAALVGVHEGLRLLVDAKDAETLQRAAHGPLRKMEIVFDEFGRQQEALLSDLVGRRRHLEELLDRARDDDSAE